VQERETSDKESLLTGIWRAFPPNVPTLTARNSLSAIWLLIYNSRGRKLTEQECAELARLCDTIPAIVGRDGFNQASEEFGLMLKSCGVFETGVVKLPERMLEFIDELQAMLNAH
jgi:hypothetical protein